MADLVRKERRSLEEDAALQRAAKRLLAAAPALAARATTQPSSTRAGTSMPGPSTQHPTARPHLFSTLFLNPAPTVVPLPPAQRPVQPLPKATLPQPRSLMLPQHGPTVLQASAARPAPCPSRARPPLAPANRQSILPPSPGWPSCSPQHARAPSDDASSPRGQGLHVLAADVREAVSGGLSGRVSKSLESLLFISSGGC